MPGLRIGTCSWKYPSWQGLVYSSGKNINYLDEYSRKYDTVEVDQWFWSLFEGNPPVLPSPKVVEEYRHSVPEDFRFTVKVPNSITLTHYYRKGPAGDLVRNPHFLSRELYAEFLESLGPLREMTGLLMFQFEYLNKQKMPGMKDFLASFGAFYDGLPHDIPAALEIRNPNYLKPDLFDFLRERGLAFVFLQGYYMPDITGVYEPVRDLIRERAVIRLHGTEREGMEKTTGRMWDQIVQNRDGELDRIAEMIKDLMNRDVEIYLNVNNHYEGSAPLTIEKIKKRLASQI